MSTDKKSTPKFINRLPSRRDFLKKILAGGAVLGTATKLSDSPNAPVLQSDAPIDDFLVTASPGMVSIEGKIWGLSPAIVTQLRKTGGTSIPDILQAEDDILEAKGIPEEGREFLLRAKIVLPKEVICWQTLTLKNSEGKQKSYTIPVYYNNADDFHDRMSSYMSLFKDGKMPDETKGDDLSFHREMPAKDLESFEQEWNKIRKKLEEERKAEMQEQLFRLILP